MSRSRRFVVSWLPALAWMMVIFSGSGDLLSSRQTSRFIRPFLHWLLPTASEQTINLLHSGARKAGHVFEYAILSGLLWRAFARRSSSSNCRRVPWRAAHAWAALSVSVLYAVTDELHQSLLSSRTGNPWDVAWDTVGALMGLVLARVVWGLWLQPVTAGSSPLAPEIK